MLGNKSYYAVAFKGSHIPQIWKGTLLSIPVRSLSKVANMPESIAEIASDLGKTTLWQNKKSIFICTLMASGAFQYGLDQGLVNGFMAMPGFLELYGVPDPQVAGGYNLSSTVQQLISSLMILGALISSLCAGFFGNYLSRRWCLFVASIVCIVATFIMIFSTSTGVLYFARILLGLAKYDSLSLSD